MAFAIVTKSVIDTVLIEDVLVDACEELEEEVEQLNVLVEILRPCLNQIVSVCYSPSDLAAVIKYHRESLAAIAPVVEVAFDAFVANVLDAT